MNSASAEPVERPSHAPAAKAGHVRYLYVGLSAVLALVCYVVVVGPIKRLDIVDLEPTARSGQ
jgi:hypothetical protein